MAIVLDNLVFADTATTTLSNLRTMPQQADNVALTPCT